LISHPYSKGNGASIKTGARAAKGDVIVFMDGDGQHLPEDVQRLLDKLADGFDMVVGARKGLKAQANIARGGANAIYNKFASVMTGQRIEDLTSGMRAVKASMFKEFLYLLPNGFSYPTTITMAFFKSGYSVGYLPISVEDRIGKSHINPLKDGIRFLLIIFKVATLYSPLKLFFPISMAFFATGIAYYSYTYITASRFTNMSALLLTTAVIVFLMGLISEQIASLIFQRSNSD
jgi:glycosyltransferase involved in cell wall biosynthesis